MSENFYEDYLKDLYERMSFGERLNKNMEKSLFNGLKLAGRHKSLNSILKNSEKIKNYLDNEELEVLSYCINEFCEEAKDEIKNIEKELNYSLCILDLEIKSKTYQSKSLELLSAILNKKKD